jgi:hypothetical protein
MLEFIESSIFPRHVYAYLTEEEFGEMQWFLSVYPDAGDLIPGSGGCRKLRWGTSAKGKSGGVRAIYCGQLADGRIWLLAIYAKSRQQNLPAHIIRALRDKLVNS